MATFIDIWLFFTGHTLKKYLKQVNQVPTMQKNSLDDFCPAGLPRNGFDLCGQYYNASTIKIYDYYIVFVGNSLGITTLDS